MSKFGSAILRPEIKWVHREIREHHNPGRQQMHVLTNIKYLLLSYLGVDVCYFQHHIPQPGSMFVRKPFFENKNLDLITLDVFLFCFSTAESLYLPNHQLYPKCHSYSTTTDSLERSTQKGVYGMTTN